MKLEVAVDEDGSLRGITVGPSRRLAASAAVCAAAHLLYELAGELREQEITRLEADLAADSTTPDRPVAEDAVEDPPPPDGPALDDRAQPAVAAPPAAAGTPTTPEQSGGGVVMHAPDLFDVDERTRAAADELLAAGVGPAAVATELALPLALVRSWKQEMTHR